MAPLDSPFRSEPVPAETLSGAERDARIEQLLLAGLDLYFASQYEQAINLWTRVLFLDRHHGRARAYIERARSAQAERQRESEAVLHQAIEAFHDGDVARARRLAADALDRGAPLDDAQGVLARIERVRAGQRAPAPMRDTIGLADRDAQQNDGNPARMRRGPGWAVAVLLIAAAVGVLAVGAWGVALPEPASWWIFSADGARRDARVIPMPPEPLPVAAAAETYLSHSRSLIARGWLHDALAELERIPIGNRLRPEADRLRGEIQQLLLNVAAADGARTPPE